MASSNPTRLFRTLHNDIPNKHNQVFVILKPSDFQMSVLLIWVLLTVCYYGLLKNGSFEPATKPCPLWRGTRKGHVLLWNDHRGDPGLAWAIHSSIF